jgi:DNA replication protein DnaC
MFFIDILEDRYQKKIHIFSSQVDIDGWKSLYEDPVTAEAIIDRIKNPSEKIQLTGTSYRERIGKNGVKQN